MSETLKGLIDSSRHDERLSIDTHFRSCLGKNTTFGIVPMRTCDHDTVNGQGQDSRPAKVAKSTSVCEYCGKEFTTRGITLHQKKCTKRQAHDKAAAKKTRSYKFSIVNEVIHEMILSFLGNQTLTKMQMLTGDRYEQCEPGLARYCCKCENDNPVVRYGFCLQCIPNSGCYFNGHATMREAKKKYGLRQKDFHSIRRLSGYWIYDWSTLAKYMLETCGSKMEWVRVLEKRDIRKKKSLDTRIQNRQMSALLRSMAPGFEAYVRAIRFTTTDEKLLEQCNGRFMALKAELIRRRLPLRTDSSPCKTFIKTGKGSVQDVVDTMEQGGG